MVLTTSKPVWLSGAAKGATATGFGDASGLFGRASCHYYCPRSWAVAMPAALSIGLSVLVLEQMVRTAPLAGRWRREDEGMRE